MMLGSLSYLPSMMSGTLLAILGTLLVTSLWEPTRAITLPGYENERSIHICKTESRNLVCESGTFIWTRNVFVGVSSAHARDATTGAVSCPMASSNDCIKASQRYYEGTTYRVYSGLEVPDEMVMCGGVETAANYVNISYSCIDSSLLSPQNMCSSSSRGFPEGYITTPGFPSPLPEDLYDCTCHLRPEVDRPAGMTVTILLMFARLPEPQECAAETWVEDQDGRRIQFGQDGLYGRCSPSTSIFLTNQTQVQSLTLRFVRTRRDYTGNLKLKVWYGFEADTHMQVTCGPTLTGNVSSVPSTTTSTTRQEVSATNLQLVTGPTPPETQLFGLGLDTVAIISAIMGCSIIIIVVVVVAVRCSRRSRSTTPSSPHDITVHYDKDARMEDISEIYLTTNTEPFGGPRPLPSPPQGGNINEKDSPTFGFSEKDYDYITLSSP